MAIIPLAVLIVEDADSDAQLMVHLLETAGYELTCQVVETAAQMRAALEQTPWDIVISDYSLPQFDGLAALKLLQETGVDIPFIAVSGTTDEAAVVAMMKAGAHDYLTKANLTRLAPTVERELGDADTRLARKRAEAALRESEYHLRRSQKIARIGHWVMDLQTKEFTWSDEMFRIFGVEPAGFTGDLDQVWRRAIHPEELERVEAASRAVGDNGQRPTIEYRVVRPDGSIRHIRATAGDNIIDPHGNVIQLTGVLQDITERKRAEAGHRAILETAMDGFWLVDTQGRLLEVNETYCRMSGYSVQELLAMRIFDLEATETAADTATHLQKIMTEGEDRFESRLCRYDGSIFDVVVSVQYRPIPEKGRFVAFLRDITERKQAEVIRAKLEAQNRQLQKTESLGRMAGAIAHHFNNQLQAVMGNLEMAMMSGTSPQNLSQALVAAGRAAEMSGLMLVYLGQTPDALEPLDLAATCAGSLASLGETLPPGVTMEVDLPDLGPVINANATRIQQLLTNLVTNAREALGDGPGSIQLTLKKVSPVDIPATHRFPLEWQPQAQDYACLAVTDSGVGIAHQDIEKLFDPFYSTKFTGRGLGLAVVLGIIRSHSGAVVVESQPGRGSTFRLFFPVVAQAVLPAPPPAQAAQYSAPAEGGTVLLVEDDELVRDMVAEMLEMMDFTVLTAADGVEAVELFRQRQADIDCVLCDLTMPRMDGWETLTALRQIAPEVPVILSSGYDEAQVMANHHSERPQAFLSKPYQIAALKDALTGAMVK